MHITGFLITFLLTSLWKWRDRNYLCEKFCFTHYGPTCSSSPWHKSQVDGQFAAISKLMQYLAFLLSRFSAFLWNQEQLRKFPFFSINLKFWLSIHFFLKKSSFVWVVVGIEVCTDGVAGTNCTVVGNWLGERDGDELTSVDDNLTASCSLINRDQTKNSSIKPSNGSLS